MKYYELAAGEKTYRIRIRMQDHAELDQLCGGNFLTAFQENRDPWALLKAMLVAGCHAAGDMRPNEADGVIDELIDGETTSDDAIALVMEIGTVSGFFTKAALASYRKVMAKVQAGLEEAEESGNA